MTRGDSIRVMHPLFQEGEGGSTPTSPLSAKALMLDRIDFRRAKALNRQWHSRMPRFGTGFVENQPFLCWAAVHGGIIYAVAIWSNPAARNLPQQTWLELRRLAIADDAPKNTASRMLRIMELLIRRERPAIVRLVSYQDTGAHTGTIYRAAGWKATTLSAEGDDWDRPSRTRPEVQSDAAKQRWEKGLGEP